MLPVGFEPTDLGGERPQTQALDRAVTGTVNITIPGLDQKYLSVNLNANSRAEEAQWQTDRPAVPNNNDRGECRTDTETNVRIFVH